MSTLSRKQQRYKDYLHSAKWRALRQEVLERDGWACARCGEKNGLQVHHLTYDRIYEEELDDLLALCNRCHLLQHEDKKPKSRRKRKRLKHLRARRKPKVIRAGPSAPTKASKRKQQLVDMNDELHRKQQEARERRAVR